MPRSMRLGWVLIFTLFVIPSWLRALDATCVGLLREMANHSRDRDTVLVFADFVRDGRLDIHGPQAHKADLIPILLTLEQMDRSSDYRSEAWQKARLDRNAHLLGDPRRERRGYFFGWFFRTDFWAQSLSDEQAEERLANNFLIEIPVPEEGINPFDTTNVERTTLPISKVKSRLLNSTGSLQVDESEIVQEGHFIRLPRGRLRDTFILDDVWIMDVPVTQLQWALVMGSNPSRKRTHGFLKIGKDQVNPHFPLETATPKEFETFLERLNALSSQSATPWRYRLPTEDEWEYAARAGALGAYCADPHEIFQQGWAWRGFTHPVGMLRPNRWGLYDVHGQVWERTSTCRPLPGSSVLSTVVKGGTHHYAPMHNDPGSTFAELGHTHFTQGIPSVSYSVYFEGIRLIRESPQNGL